MLGKSIAMHVELSPYRCHTWHPRCPTLPQIYWGCYQVLRRCYINYFEAFYHTDNGPKPSATRPTSVDVFRLDRAAGRPDLRPPASAAASVCDHLEPLQGERLSIA